MYPHPPASHRPTNYFWILLACLAVLLVVVFNVLGGLSGRLNEVAGDPANASRPAATSARPSPSAIVLAPPPATSAPATILPSSAPVVVPPSGIVDVDAKALNDTPDAYKGKVVRVKGTLFYSGRLADGKTWVQIVNEANLYVDGQLTEALPAGIGKGSRVTVTGIGAGLTTITASNGKDYDQAFLDPIQKIEEGDGR